MNNSNNNYSQPSKQPDFICPCPVENCRGLVRTSDKSCAACNSTICGMCREAAIEMHICDRDKVKTVNLLKKETKPCPKCTVAIMKSSGCDQMFCTNCAVPFSWNTGEIIRKGFFHNPYALEWMDRTGKRIQLGQNDDDSDSEECGVSLRLSKLHQPDIDSKESKSERDGRDERDTTIIDVLGDTAVSMKVTIGDFNWYQRYRHDIHQGLVHARAFRTLDEFQLEKYNNTLELSRTKYLIGENSEAKWEKNIFTTERGMEKKRMVCQFYDLYYELGGDIVRYYRTGGSTLSDLRKQLESLTDYITTTQKEDFSVLGFKNYPVLSNFHWE